MKADTKETKSMVKGNSSSPLEILLKEFGKMETTLDKEHIPFFMVISSLECTS